MTERERYIVTAFRDKKLKVSEITLLLKREGFAPVTRTRVYQVLEKYGINVG